MSIQDQGPQLPATGNPGQSPAPPHRTRNRILAGLGMLAGLVVLAGLGGATWASNAGWRLEPPQVLGIAPAAGSHDVAGNASISIAFNMPMNPDSVRQHLTIDPPTDGTVRWEGNTLLFQPKPGYRRGVTYTVQIGAGASSPLMQALAAPSSTTFKTAGLPGLYRSVPPADAANVPTDTMVTLQFSAPMVALTTLGPEGTPAPDPGAAVRIQPDAGGRWQWLGSTTLAYRAAALQPATHYTVSVARSLADYAGGTLDRDYTVSFVTSRPAVVATRPEAATKFAGPRDPIVVTFNQPVDRASAEAGFRLAPAAAGSFAWSPAGDVFTYTVSAALPEDAPVQATLSGVKPAHGDEAQAAPYTWGFRTSPRPQVSELQPKEGATNVPSGNEILVHYSAPVSNTNEELLAGLRFDPPVKGASAYAYDEGATLNIFAPLTPSTHYTVTVGANDSYRGRDGRPVPARTWHFTTGRLSPDARVLSNDNLVSYYAGLPTRVFLSAVNVDGFLRLRVWKLDADELAAYMQLSTEQRAQYQPRGPLARTWDLPVTYRLNQQLSLNPLVALDDKADRLPPGYYFLRVSTPETPNSPGTIQGAALIVGHTGLVMKQSAREVWIWAVDMGTGKPQAGRRLQVRAGTQAVGTLTTDADGLAHRTDDWSRYNSQPIVLMDDPTDAGVVTPWWNDSIGPWNFDLSFKNRRWNNGSAVYTDRAIYRPGQPVFFKGIAREDDDGKYTLPTRNALITLSDNNGREVYSATQALSLFGTFTDQYTLPAYAPLGTYYLNCRCLAAEGTVGTSFEVQEYRKPEYIVEVTTDKKSYVNGESIRAGAGASYFFGGPVASAAVTNRVLTQDYFFTWQDPDTGASYDFQDYQAISDRLGSYNGEKISETTGTTDAAGKVSLTLPADVSKAPLSQVETIEASLQDSSNQAVSSNTQVVVHKGQYYIGLRPASYLETAGNPVTIRVQTVAPDGARYPNAALALKFYRRVWEQTTEKDAQGLDQPTWKPRDTPVGTGQVTTDAQGRAQASFTPKEAGEYRVVAEGRDAAGNTLTSATYAYVSAADADAAPIPWRQKNNSVVSLVADKPSYRPGDTARILVTSPFSQAVGLLTVERGHILSHRLVDLRGPAPVIDVPIDEGYLPNVYISLSMIAPAGGQGAALDAPDFRQGYLALPVSAAAKQLVVTITPSSQEAHPRDTITYTMIVRDAAGQPVQAELSLAVVDKAIFSLAGDSTPTLIDSFYGIRPLDFSTASSLLVLADQVARGKTASKGGGGGGGGDFVRRQFSDTAYWRGQVTTDANGQAVVAVPLPDNLTTWRLTALAVTQDTRVGQAQNEILSTKPLLLRPTLPRFLVAGDQAQPGVIIENHTPCAPDVDVTLVLSGATFLPDSPKATQRVHLEGQQQVAWKVAAGSANRAIFNFTVTGGTCNGAAVGGDSVEIPLPVQAPITTEAVTTSGAVEANGTATEHVLLPYGVDPNRGELQLNITPSLAAGAAEGVEYVKENPYDSTEQTVSRFLPLLRLDKAYTTAGLTTTFGAEVPGLVNRGIVRLYHDQHYDGGWGWFETSPSDPYLTAYALEGLTAARAAGYDVTQQVIDNVVSYLQQWLSAGPPDARGVSPRFNTRAYVLYVLALNGQGDLALARALAVRAPSLALYGRAYLALAFQRLGAAEDANRLLTDLASAAQQTTITAHWEEPAGPTAEAYLDMDSNARTSALILQGLLARNKADALIPRSVRWLMENRRAGHWLSSQETATVLATLAAYLAASGEPGTGGWSVAFNNRPWGNSGLAGSGITASTDLRKRIADLLINQDNTITISRQAGGGPLYYTLDLDYTRPGAQAPARNEGLSIIREYVQPGAKAGEVPQPLRSAAAGALVEVRLTVIAPTEAYYLVAEDPLPAGLEAVNGTLQTTGLTERLDAIPPGGDTEKGDDGQASMASFFDQVEMRDDRTVLYAGYLPAGVYEYRYLARATTPGSYTVLPATAQLTYLPDVWGRSDSGTFTVTGK